MEAQVPRSGSLTKIFGTSISETTMRRKPAQAAANAERDERQILARQLRELENRQGAREAAAARSEAALAELPGRISQLELGLARAAVADDMTKAVAAAEKRLQQRMATLSDGLDEYHRDFSDVAASLASGLKSKQAKIGELGDTAVLAAHRIESLERVTNSTNTAMGC
jgi:chromosome segregation ATPase